MEKLPSLITPTGTDVTELYPEIVSYWMGKGMPRRHIEVKSYPELEEDCLFLYGRWHSYCRCEFEWKLEKDVAITKKLVYYKERLTKILNTDIPK